MITKTKLSHANACIENDIQALHDIHQKAKNIAIYQRNIEMLPKHLIQLATTSIECRANGTVTEITKTLSAYFTDELPAHQALLQDILNLLGLFEEVSKTSSFRLLLATVDTNMCRRFHTDINDLRMLCTYVGPGTFWVPDAAINEKAFQKKGAQEEIVLDESLIQQVETGDVVILKGALYPEANPILHRSPTIEGTGEKRLLLRIDTNAALNLWT